MKGGRIKKRSSAIRNLFITLFIISFILISIDTYNFLASQNEILEEIILLKSPLGLNIGWSLLFFTAVFYFIYKDGNPYAGSWEFIKNTKWFFVFSLGIFFFIALLGFIFPIFFERQIEEVLRRMGEMLIGKNVFEIIIMIFMNNTRAAFMAMISGIAFGIITILILITNGYLLGFVARITVNAGRAPILLGLLPYGIFELTAIFLSAAIGLRYGYDLILNTNQFGKIFKTGIKVFIFIIVPILLLAAIIEGIMIAFINIT
jgi:stage II sporulation protein M